MNCIHWSSQQTQVQTAQNKGQYNITFQCMSANAQPWSQRKGERCIGHNGVSEFLPILEGVYAETEKIKIKIKIKWRKSTSSATLSARLRGNLDVRPAHRHINAAQHAGTIQQPGLAQEC